MIKDKILIDLQGIFRVVFKDDQLMISFETNQNDIEDWDSLNHAILFEAIEKHYSVKFNLMDMITIQKVDDICEKLILLKQEN